MTIQLNEVVDAVLLPAQKEILYGFDEVTAIYTICDEILIEESNVAEADLIDRITRLIEPIQGHLQSPHTDSLKDRVTGILREGNRYGYLNFMPDGTIRHTPNGKEHVAYHQDWDCFNNFNQLVYEVSKLRNLM